MRLSLIADTKLHPLLIVTENYIFFFGTSCILRRYFVIVQVNTGNKNEKFPFGFSEWNFRVIVSSCSSNVSIKKSWIKYGLNMTFWICKHLNNRCAWFYILYMEKNWYRPPTMYANQASSSGNKLPATTYNDSFIFPTATTIHELFKVPAVLILDDDVPMNTRTHMRILQGLRILSYQFRTKKNFMHFKINY